MMAVSKRILAAMSAIGVAATLASCQLPGGSGANGEGASAPASASAPKSAQAGGGAHGAAIESHPTTVDSKPGTVSLNSVSGAGTTITVMFSVTNNDKKNDMWIYDSFSDGDDSVPQPSGKASPGGSTNNEVFSPDAFVEGEDDQGCGGDRGDGSGIEGDVLEGLEVLDQGVGPLGGSPH